MQYLSQLPEKGWGVIRCPASVMFALWAGGYIKVQLTPVPNAYNARLTGPGRTLRNSL